VNDDVLHVASGRLFNLHEADVGGDDRALVEEIYSRRPVKRGVLLCLKHGSDLYLRPVRGHFWGVHFDGTHADHRPFAGMSDEHKRQTDYLVRAAEDAGFSTEREVALPGVRPDAVVTGPLASVAIEVQRSALTAAAAVLRTKKTIAAGLATSVWFNDRDQSCQPSWAFKVPTIGMNLMRWDTLPPRRAAAVTTGVRIIKAERCDGGQCRWGRRGKRACGGFHPVHVPHLVETATNRTSYRERDTFDRALKVDDVAMMLPAKLLLPLRFRGRDVLLVPPESVARYEELTGRPAELVFNPLAASVVDARPDPGLRECVSARPVLWRDEWPERWEQLQIAKPTPEEYQAINPAPAHGLVSPPRAAVQRGRCFAGRQPCGAEAQLYTCGWRCDKHRPGGSF
jgi:hypothetical protein